LGEFHGVIPKHALPVYTERFTHDDSLTVSRKVACNLQTIVHSYKQPAYNNRTSQVIIGASEVDSLLV